MTSREDSVLAARDPALEDENDWEEFSLCEARVLIPGKSRYAHLLSASPDNPVQVTGCLDEVEEEQESLVLDEDYLNKRIVIENVTHYAYGQHKDGEIGVWVAGSAGWFALSPAKGYRAIFNDAVEAIDLLYFLADQHQRRQKRRRASYPSVEFLCEEYVNHTHGICEDAEDSAEVFYKHRDFLFPRMLKGEEDVDWINTSLFTHLCEKFPEDYEQAKARVQPQSEEEEEEEEEPEEETNSDEKETAGTDSDEKDANNESSQSDSFSVPKAQADLIYQVILDLKDAGHLAKRQLNLELVASELMSRYEIGTETYARDLISARAKIILDLMKQAKTSNFDWSRKAIYKELKTASKRSGMRDITITPLRRRAKDIESSDESDVESQPRTRRRRVQKSVLRPKLSSKSAKQTGKRNREAGEEDEFDDNEDADEYETPSKIRGHELVRDPLSTRAKRRTRSILSESPIRKTPLQETLQSRNTSVSAFEQDIVDSDAGKLDGFPPDTWVCQAPGCGRVIYKSSSKRGKELAQDHSLTHASDTQTRLDLVFSEQRLNINLPVDNLIGRIQEMGSLNPELAGMANGTSSMA